MRKLAFLFVAFALVAVSFYGCDETNITEPTDSDEILLKANGPRARLSSTFDSENDGWTLVGDADYSWTGDWNYSLYPQYDATGGNPGGHIRVTDVGKQMAFFFQAPPKYLGNQYGAYGGMLQYDVKWTGSGTPSLNADVILAGGGMTLVIIVDPTVGADWTTVRIGLTEDAGWRIKYPFGSNIPSAEDMKTVLKDLHVLRIRGEYSNGIDTGYLDNVRIIPKGQVK